MKVITAGEVWAKQYGCPGCKTEMEIDSDDVRFTRQHHSSIWGSHEDWYDDLFYFICVSCKTILELGEIPAWVRNKARSR